MTEVEIQFYVEIDAEGSPFIFWGTDGILPNGTEMSYGEPITDNAVLRQIRKSEVYKERLIQASLEKRNTLNEQNQILTSLHKKSPKILGVADLELERIKIDSDNYREKLADEIKPDKNKYRSKLEIEAKSAVNSILFWKNKSKRRDYVDNRFLDEFPKLLGEWNEKVESLNSDLDLISSELGQSLAGTRQYITHSYEKMLADIEIPVDISVDFEYDGKIVKLDLDLPEIEEMPNQIASINSRDHVVVKDKTQKKSKEDYARCVTGLAFFLAASTFNISPSPEESTNFKLHSAAVQKDR